MEQRFPAGSPRMRKRLTPASEAAPARAGLGAVTRLCAVVGVERVTGLKEIATVWSLKLAEGSGRRGLQHA